MITKRTLLNRYLLWRNLHTPYSNPNSDLAYPHCLNCKYYISCCTKPLEEKYTIYYKRSVNYDIKEKDKKFHLRKNKRYYGEKCIRAFAPGNWVKKK